MMLLLAIAAGMSLVSCNKQKGEKKYSATESANKIDATGEAFVQELDLEKWQATADLVMPAINFMDTSHVKLTPEPEIAVSDTIVNVKDTLWTVTTTIDMANCKGHYSIEANNMCINEDGEFNDFKVAFSAGGHDYVADITFTNSDKKVLLVYSESKPGYYYNENHQTVYVDGMQRQNYYYLVLPSKMTVEFMADASTPFTVEGNLSYDGVLDPRELTDLAAITINVDLAVKAGDYTMNLSKLSLNGGSFDEAFTFKRNNKQLLQLTANATGITMLENESLKSGAEEEEDDLPYTCDNAQLSLDVLGLIQVKGNVKFNDLYIKLLAVTSDPQTVEEGNKILKDLEPYYSLNVYYDKGSVVQASVKAKAYETDSKKIEVMPVIFFQDGTSEAVPEFFTKKYIGKTIAAVEALEAKIEEYIKSFEPESQS